MNVATRLKLEQMERDIESLKERVAVLERQESAHYTAIDQLLERSPPAPRETLTLEKRKSA